MAVRLDPRTRSNPPVLRLLAAPDVSPLPTTDLCEAIAADEKTMEKWSMTRTGSEATDQRLAFLSKKARLTGNRRRFLAMYVIVGQIAETHGVPLETVVSILADFTAQVAR